MVYKAYTVTAVKLSMLKQACTQGLFHLIHGLLNWPTLTQRFVFLTSLNCVCVLCISLQCLWDSRPVRWRFVCVADVSSPKGAEAGQVHASSQETAGGLNEDNGQCGHLLHVTHALHLHFQVTWIALDQVLYSVALNCWTWNCFLFCFIFNNNNIHFFFFFS